MDKEFLKLLLSELESLYEALIPLKDTTETIEPEFILEMLDYLAEINEFLDTEFLLHKDKLTCLCGGEDLFNKIFFFRDKISELLKPLELRASNKEFTSKMFKTHSKVLFERKLGFLVNKETYNKILAYIQLNKFKDYEPEQFNIVVKHPALPYTVRATVKPKDYLKRVLTDKSRYSMSTAPYLYLDVDNFKDDNIHGIEVMNYSDHYRFLEYFIQHAAMLKSSIVELSEIEDPPMGLLYGKESVTASMTEKDMTLHDYIKLTFNKSLDSSSYNKRYYMVKYLDGAYLFRDNSHPEEKAILIAKDENNINKVLHDCKCRRLIRP